MITATPALKTIALALSILLCLSSCAQHVVLRPPYPQKLRVGDGVKLVEKDGTRHAGRIVYLDRAVVILRTPSQISMKRPVKSERFGTSISWENISQVKASGTLDSQRKFVSSETVRLNRRTAHYRNLAVNVGLLGLGIGFLAGTWVQDSVAPVGANQIRINSGASTLAFWATFLGGTVGSALIGYKIGKYLDNRGALERIERQRARQRKTQAQIDSLLTKTREKINQMNNK